MLIFLILAIIIALLFYLINILIYYLNRDSNSNSALISTYECGFETITNQVRTEHSISYYLIALLYVIFDLEIALVLPALISLHVIGTTGSVLLLLIMTVLCFAFVYEFKLGTFNYVNKLQ